MATILERPNGTYLVRVSCGRDPAGRQIIKSKVFTPSAPKLSFARLKKELDQFTKEFEEELSSQNVKSDPKKITFVEFCEKYLDVKRSSLSPTTMQYYEKVIHDMLIPLYGKMRMRELKTYHVQQFIQYLANDYHRVDGRDSETSHICATTVKRYNYGCGAVLIADIVLDNQQRSNTALLGTDSRIKVGVVNLSPFYKSFHVFLQGNIRRLSSAM